MDDFRPLNKGMPNPDPGVTRCRSTSSISRRTLGDASMSGLSSAGGEEELREVIQSLLPVLEVVCVLVH
ncbi:MAG: hypothetical protein ACKPGI_03920, partial [Verrucomicrobiota bacterium]